MKKRFRLRLLGVCFLALFTIFASFSTPAFADPDPQGGQPPATPMPPQPPPQQPSIPPEILWIILTIL